MDEALVSIQFYSLLIIISFSLNFIINRYHKKKLYKSSNIFLHQQRYEDSKFSPQPQPHQYKPHNNGGKLMEAMSRAPSHKDNGNFQTLRWHYLC